MIRQMIRLFFLCVLVLVLSTCDLFMGIDEERFDGFVNFDYVSDRITTSYGLLSWKENKNNFRWDDVRRNARRHIRKTMSPEDLINVLKNMLGEFKDAHIYFRLPDGTRLYPVVYHTKRFEESYSGFDLSRVLYHYLAPNTRGNSMKNMMWYGRLDDSRTSSKKKIGYLYISSFIMTEELDGIKTLQPWARDIDGIVAELINTDGLILDLRQNGGGFPGNMLHIAGRFAKSRKHFMNTYMKNGPGRDDFADPYKWYVEPGGPRQYTKPIVLITDGGSGSTSEYFTLAMRSFDYVTHFGQNTLGMMGYVMSIEMPNGWGLNYSTGYSVGFTAQNKEINYEQDGIPPKNSKNYMSYTEVQNTAGYVEGSGEIDPMLDKAITVLLGKL